ncbi:MAG: DUF3500 domain-containing protein [Pirellulales bacterium]|nr:DUF3500 domain-containing protein [Pirellulales bacterium]
MPRLLPMLASTIALVACVQSTTAAEPSTETVAAAMTAAAEKFLDTLDAKTLAVAQMKFDDPARLDWHNIPKPKRKGVQLRDMTTDQRAACHELLRTALSQTGYDKAIKIMALENNLREGEKDKPGSPLRDPERYFLTIFGTPAADATWGWSFEGHHFSLNFVISDGRVASDTPSFWGANPATVRIAVPGGPEPGIRTLADEEQLALDLVASLSAAELHEAVIANECPADYRAAGLPRPPQAPPEGIAAAKLSAAQRETLVALLAAYSGNLAEPLAAARLADIKAAGIDRVYFAWAGATQAGAPHYYRVQGPTFVLELVNYQSDPAGNPANHIHSVWRSLTHDFGLSSK